jgi:ATP-dependent Clp protease, protease subunit
MSLRDLPAAAAPARPKNFQWDAPSDVLARWAQTPVAAADDSDPAVITMYEVIGEDWWTGGGVTAVAVERALRAAGPVPVTVKINSPGGDMFEGIAIYNLLREHKAKVTVEVMGWAASAASIIAMAGDEIIMGLGTFMMVHNAWGVAIGNRHDFQTASAMFEQFDAAIADIYEARTGMKRADIVALMDGETFMAPDEAIKTGFADSKADIAGEAGAAANSADRALMARRQTEAALARAGFSRSDRSQVLAILSGAPRDASTQTAARDAGDLKVQLDQLAATMRP